jgi:hypothetical protein
VGEVEVEAGGLRRGGGGKGVEGVAGELLLLVVGVGVEVEGIHGSANQPEIYNYHLL